MEAFRKTTSGHEPAARPRALARRAIYPEEAKQQGVQGTVKLHAIIGRQGSVENLESVDGSPVLVAAAMNAVRQWRYTETLLAGQSVETEEDIAITFRLSNPTPPRINLKMRKSLVGYEEDDWTNAIPKLSVPARQSNAHREFFHPIRTSSGFPHGADGLIDCAAPPCINRASS